MTDKEIIKALECCHSTKGGCKDCPLNYRRSADCVDYLEENALDLIRRQQEKINQFAEADKMVVETKTVKNDDEEILRLLVNQSVKFIPKNDDIKAIQRDAVVNFAERLKPLYKTLCVDEGDWYYEIDNLVSEMFPEQKGETNDEP